MIQELYQHLKKLCKKTQVIKYTSKKLNLKNMINTKMILKNMFLNKLKEKMKKVRLKLSLLL